MKKIISSMLILLMLVAAVSGCSNKATTQSNRSDKLTVVTTLFYQYDFARQILGEYGEVELLLRPGQESHSYEPTPADIIKIQEADLFIYNGGVAESWVAKVLEGIDRDQVQVICMMNQVDVVNEEIVPGMETEEAEHEEAEEEDDEHIWTSPVNAQKLVQVIADECIKLDQKHEDTYETNSQSYIAEIQEIDQAFRQVVSSSKQKTMVFGDRFPLRYFADEYGLSYYAAFPGCSTETEPGAGTIAFLTEEIKAKKIPAVYYLELSNEKIADTLCENTGAKKLLFHSCHNVTSEEIDGGATYVSLMKQNVERLREGLE